jgi:hypothetical protein
MFLLTFPPFKASEILGVRASEYIVEGGGGGRVINSVFEILRDFLKIEDIAIND